MVWHSYWENKKGAVFFASQGSYLLAAHVNPETHYILQLMQLDYSKWCVDCRKRVLAEFRPPSLRKIIPDRNSAVKKCSFIYLFHWFISKVIKQLQQRVYNTLTEKQGQPALTAVLKQCKSVTNGGMLLYGQNHRVAYTARGNNAQSHKISGMWRYRLICSNRR